eukprot:6492265-Amphidinium_carterae.1
MQCLSIPEEDTCKGELDSQNAYWMWVGASYSCALGVSACLPHETTLVNRTVAKGSTCQCFVSLLWV